jgi:hypothetical protein
VLETKEIRLTTSRSIVAASLAAGACMFGAGVCAAADDTTFIPFANVGSSYSAAIFQSDERVGREVISATITLNLTVDEGSNAAEFFTDLLLPLDTGPVVVIDGAERNWTGSGNFSYQLTTTELNGFVIARRYGAETFGVQGEMSDDSGVLLTFRPVGCAADFNGDNQADFFDYLDFAVAFDAEDPSADFNGDNQVDFFDYLDFVQAFDAGCQ